MDGYDFLSDDAVRNAVVGVFRDHGVAGQVFAVPTEGSDEAIFAVSTTDAARMREAELTIALTQLLSRKVWVTTDTSSRSDRLIPLADSTE